jgi:hypothetical protein
MNMPLGAPNVCGASHSLFRSIFKLSMAEQRNWHLNCGLPGLATLDG